MRHLSTVFHNIKESIEASVHLLLLLDYDGTLAPIVANPSEAFLPTRALDALKSLNQKAWCTIAILSGRDLDDLVERIGVEGIIYGGNHGVQLRGPGIDFQAPLLAGTEDSLKAIASSLGFSGASVDGLFIENKGGSVSVHYRNVETTRATEIENLVRGIVEPFVSSGLVKIRRGKKVFDITPRSWDKGRAVTWLLDRLSLSKEQNGKMCVVYFGDDTTDEDAFEAIGEHGISVLVGCKHPSNARYYVTGPEEVHDFLSSLLCLF
jgi:trehalose-phosphatase